MQLKKLIMGILSLTLLTSCTAGLLNGIDVKMSSSPNTISPESKGPKLTFTPITKDHEKLISGASGGNNGVGAALDMATPTMAKGEVATVSGPMPVPSGTPAPSDYSFGFRTTPTGSSGFSSSWGYYGGGFDEYILSEVTEASTSGFVGNFSDVKNNITPYVKGWSNDARLVNFSGNVDGTGNNPAQEPAKEDLQNKYDYYYYAYGNSAFGWMFEYTSSAQKEKLIIYVTAKETLYIKQKWTLKDMAVDEIVVNSNKAVQLIKDAVKDKNFTPKPQPGASIAPVTPWWGAESKEEYEIIYDLPSDTYWDLYLYKEVSSQYNRVVWNINFRIPFARPKEETKKTVNGVDMIYPMPWMNSGYAKVDAKTGDILEMTRPYKYTPKPYAVYTSSPGPIYSRVPVPVTITTPSLPTATPTAVPSASPTPSPAL